MWYLFIYSTDKGPIIINLDGFYFYFPILITYYYKLRFYYFIVTL